MSTTDNIIVGPEQAFNSGSIMRTQVYIAVTGPTTVAELIEFLKTRDPAEKIDLDCDCSSMAPDDMPDRIIELWRDV
jgi:hypothetical protein